MKNREVAILCDRDTKQPSLIQAAVRPSEAQPGRLKVALFTEAKNGDKVLVSPEFRLEMN